MLKKKYEEPNCSVIFLQQSDIMTISGNGEGFAADRSWSSNPWSIGGNDNENFG